MMSGHGLADMLCTDKLYPLCPAKQTMSDNPDCLDMLCYCPLVLPTYPEAQSHGSRTGPCPHRLLGPSPTAVAQGPAPIDFWGPAPWRSHRAQLLSTSGAQLLSTSGAQPHGGRTPPPPPGALQTLVGSRPRGCADHFDTHIICWGAARTHAVGCSCGGSGSQPPGSPGRVGGYPNVHTSK